MRRHTVMPKVRPTICNDVVSFWRKNLRRMKGIFLKIIAIFFKSKRKSGQFYFFTSFVFLLIACCVTLRRSPLDTSSFKALLDFLNHKDTKSQRFTKDKLIGHSPFSTHHSPYFLPPHSVLKLFTGFAIAAPIAWKLIVTSVIIKVLRPAMRNIVQVMLIL